jgi:multisubunit Na+/H+ antiporter MnhC subunit
MDISMFAVILFFISFFGLLLSKNIIKSIISVLIMQTATVLFWLTLNVPGTTPEAPIIYNPSLLDDIQSIADPVPQSATITAIIIGFAVSAIVITMFNAMCRQYGTADWETMERLATGEEKAKIHL